MLTFDAPLFALAGLLAAAVPLLIHLLNRRRFQVVAWGAMEFLRQALERHRRAFELRDLLILILRMLVICLIGFALARPFLQGPLASGLFSGGLFLLLAVVAVVGAAACLLTRGARQRGLAGGIAAASLIGVLGLWGWSASVTTADGEAPGTARLPVHAVLIIDNSRSMGVVATAGTRLERAMQQARRFVHELPAGSRISLIPAGGSEQPFPLDAFASRADVERVLSEMTLSDAADEVVGALELAELACQQVSEPDIKRVVYFTDLQSPRWNQVDWVAWGQRLPGMQIVPVAEGDASNISIQSFVLEDGFAGAEAASRFLGTLRADGLIAPVSVEAIMRVDGETIGSQIVEMSAGQTRELEFFHQFEVAGEPGRPQWSEVSLQIRPDSTTADRLPMDNSLTILVPVLDTVPVVFIDQYGDREDVSRGRIGETYALRHLLAPRVAVDEAPRRLIHVEHVQPESVTPELLEAARLVVVAGVSSPELLTSTLREYVVQGGPLVVLAGGDFNAGSWQALGWLDGRGILPLPLREDLLGALPQASTHLDPFFVDFGTLQGRDFLIEGEDSQLLGDLFESTPFFQAVKAESDPETIQSLRELELKRWVTELEFLKAQSSLHSNSARTPAVRDRMRQLEPHWWAWRSPLPVYPVSLAPEQIVEREEPRVIARFTKTGFPWVIERQVGRGTILFFSSGVTSDWNLLRTSGAMYVFHRALFRLMTGTLPERNVTAGQRAVLPLAAAGRDRWELERPGGRRESLSSEVLEAGVSGLVIRRNVVSGIYHVRSTEMPSPDSNTNDRTDDSLIATWAMQGAVSESELGGSDVQQLRGRAGTSTVTVLNVGGAPRLEGGLRRGEKLWKWGIVAALLGLTAEMAVLGGSRWGGGVQ